MSMPAELDSGGRSAGSLLAVFAHPDDESVTCGGLLARCADLGVRVSVLCLTRGEHGRGPDGGGLGNLRTQELAAAAEALGVSDVLVLDHEDGMLPWIDTTRLEADIVAAIERFEADCVVTFDEDGLYWHPDHVAVHERVTAAIAGLGAAAPALFYASVPVGMMRSVIDAAAGDPGCSRATAPGILGIEDVDAFGSHAPTPTIVFDAEEWATRKVSALRCHRSQVEGSALDCIDERVAARLLATEHYRRASIGRPGDTLLDQLGTPAAVSREA